MQSIVCFTDGGARGNPGPSGIGVVITDGKGNTLHEEARAIGNATNNFAEYYAVMTCLQLLKERLGSAAKETSIEIRLDSELVKKQLSHEYQIKEPGLIPMFIEIHNLRVDNFPKLTFTHIPREQNKEADRLANKAMDAVEKK